MLEMFERLLAALIILALLVLVMFIALPYPTGSDRANAPIVDQPTPVEPTPAPSETARAKSPPAGQENVANNDVVPQPSEKPAAGAQDVPVPNPPGNSAENTGKPPAPIPAPAEKGDRQIPAGETQPKQKFVKMNQDRLATGAEQAPKPAVALKGDKPVTEKPVAAKPKSDKLKIQRPKTEMASRLPALPPRQPVYLKDDPRRNDGIGDYIRRTDYSESEWHRTHYYECTDGRCECSCDRPYWARSGPPCWD